MRDIGLHLKAADFHARVAPLFATGLLELGDIYPVDHAAALYHEGDGDVLLACALALRAVREGHVGVDLARAGELSLPRQHGGEPLAYAWPEPKAWLRKLRQSRLVGSPDRQRPFVTQELGDGTTLLMSLRMWHTQETLALYFLTMASDTPEPCLAPAAIDESLLRLGLAEGQSAKGVRLAASRRLSVITGGPGTGKTTSIKNLLPVLLESELQEGRTLNIQLAAPTGKAAARMKESLAEGLAQMPIPENIREIIAGLAPNTIHKLLGKRPDGTTRHNRKNPLNAHVVVVDEASMIDLQLMLQLVEAIPQGARLILLGDRDQLASVEAGSVLADLLRGAERSDQASELHQSVAFYRESFRFKQAPTIAHIAARLQEGGEGERQSAVAMMCEESRAADETIEGRVRWIDRRLNAPADTETGTRSLSTDALDILAEPYLDTFVAALTQAIADVAGGRASWTDATLHAGILQAFDQYRVLAVHRKGPRGVEGLERELGTRLRAAIEAEWKATSRKALPVKLDKWLGQPVLITQNSYDVGLMNGDIGLVLPEGESGELAAVFPDARRQTQVRAVPLTRLPPHQGALALTVHKSQGSQFPHVAVVLAERASPIQTRELVYTGVTRAKAHLSWLGRREVLEQALSTRVQRASGLDALLVQPDWQVRAQKLGEAGEVLVWEEEVG